MSRIWILLVLLLFSVSCTPSTQDIINDLFDYEEESYECYHGNARLPAGTHPEYLTGSWNCEDSEEVSDIRLHSDGTFWSSFGGSEYADLLEYWSECGGNPGAPHLGLTGSWVVDTRNRLCLRRDNIQPGIYICSEFTYDSGVLTSPAYADFYDSDGDHIGREYEESGVCIREEE